MTTPDTSTTSAEPITEPTTEIESRGQTPRNFIAEALHSQTEALEIADIENRLERIIRERGIETPLTKPKNARRRTINL